MQCSGGIAGTMVAHLMFDLTPLAIGIKGRDGPSQLFAEAVATFTLVLVILGGLRYAATAVPWLVGLTITAAYWFTSSTSFANPAVTLARGFTASFSGIALGDVPGFILAQLVGAAKKKKKKARRRASCRRGHPSNWRPGRKPEDIDLRHLPHAIAPEQPGGRIHTGRTHSQSVVRCRPAALIVLLTHRPDAVPIRHTRAPLRWSEAIWPRLFWSGLFLP